MTNADVPAVSFALAPLLSHEAILTAVRTLVNLDNSLFNIQDPVFGLLGNAAATPGLGK